MVGEAIVHLQSGHDRLRLLSAAVEITNESTCVGLALGLRRGLCSPNTSAK